MTLTSAHVRVRCVCPLFTAAEEETELHHGFRRMFRRVDGPHPKPWVAPLKVWLHLVKSAKPCAPKKFLSHRLFMMKEFQQHFETAQALSTSHATPLISRRA